MSQEDRRRISYAQNGEDVRAWRALRDVAEPFYVEVGASHPFDDSLTAALSAEGWRGVLVEPEPAAADLLREVRPRDVVLAAAASDAPGLLRWDNRGQRGEGQVVDDGGVAVPAVRLGDVLEQLGVDQVHFMSLDVEGHEQRALLGLDLDRWRPWVLAVEATAPSTRIPTHEQWEPLVLQAGYRFVAFDGLNRWYVAPGHHELAQAVAEPFSVLDVMLDRWQRRDVSDLEQVVQRTRAEADRLRVERDAAVTAGVDLQRRLEAAHARVDEQERRVAELEDQLRQAAHQLEGAAVARAAAEVRERVMLESKSWRLTAPLRSARWRAGTAATRWGRRAAPGATGAVPQQAPEVVQRRLLALRARAAAAVRRAGAAG